MPYKGAFFQVLNELLPMKIYFGQECGTLEIKGIKAQQDFMATIVKTPEDGLLAEAHFDIDRTKWGVIYGSARFYEYLGMHLVFDLISFQVRIVAT